MDPPGGDQEDGKDFRKKFQATLSTLQEKRVRDQEQMTAFKKEQEESSKSLIAFCEKVYQAQYDSVKEEQLAVLRELSSSIDRVEKLQAEIDAIKGEIKNILS